MNPSTPAPTTSSQAMQNMNSFASNMKTPDQLLQNEQQNLGTEAAQHQVQGLQQAINNTTNLLNNVAPSVMGRTANSLETTAQANAEIGNEQAPINQQLGQQQQAYNTANTDYSNLEQKAENLASQGEASQQNQLGYLQNIYQALYGQEQNAQARADQQAQQAEAIRQYNQNYALSQQQAKANVASPTLGSNSNPQQNGANMTQRNGGGFNFTGTNGSAISAGSYAKLAGVPIGTLLQQMGSQGDTYAQQAYNEIQSNLGYYNAHPEALKQEFSPLFWGT